MRKTGDYSEMELLSALQQGRPPDDAIRQLYRSYFDMAWGFIRQNNGNQQDAEDIFQEVVIRFIELVQKHKFRGETSINNFLYSITRHIWLNELKRRGRAQRREVKYDREADKAEEGHDSWLAEREIKIRLMSLIDELGEACRTILIAFYYEGRSMREILGMMDYQNEQVLRNKKYKCMLALEERLTGDAGLTEYLKSALL